MVEAGIIEIVTSVEFFMGALMALAGEKGIQKAMALRGISFANESESEQQPQQQQMSREEYFDSYYNEQPSEQQERTFNEEPGSAASGEEDLRSPQEYDEDEYQAGPRR